MTTATADSIPSLTVYDDASLDAHFAALETQVEADAAGLGRVAGGREEFHLRWLGRKQGRLKLVSDAWLKTAPPDARRALGQRFNQLKAKIEAVLAQAGAAASADAHTALDISLPGAARSPGVAHPLRKTLDEVVRVFHHLGYSTALGPQVESDFYNFEALNFPPNHPARDTQDTLLVAGQQTRPARDRLLMRTHTSPVQVRTMIEQSPPIRIVVPGKVHRNDAADATHSPVFHQVEGLCVGQGITFSDLKGTLDHAMKALFGSQVRTRFFPSFFPFTEPSADVQISCIFCGGKGCRKCKHSGWIELLGCGMVDPAVFAAVDRERIAQGRAPAYAAEHGVRDVSGFAFGMGVERIAMILHGVSDIGLFYSGDVRFLEQFG
ncbi:MAG: phenylalanine--tRNA ligase subunit alpha [Acidobacteriota bacterium]|nr:phenylalanine--tRNA ligase subunit alpha [Acidobacteriota bacterium]